MLFLYNKTNFMADIATEILFYMNLQISPKKDSFKNRL